MGIIKKIGSLLEEHIEKVVLAIVGLVCIWLMITRVLISPNVVAYNNAKYSPREIDKQIREDVKELEFILKQPSDSKRTYISKLNGPLDPNDPVREGIYGPLQSGFEGLLASAINGVDTRWSIPMPDYISSGIGGGREYTLPLTDGVIGEVKDVAVEHIRAAAYVPTLMVTADLPYENAAPAPNDIDLVTVEAKFDVAGLYKEFYERFAGIDVPQQWRDPCLAVPVFAAVQLQRQELLATDQVGGGSWSDWQNVPRSKIDHRKRVFEIIEEIENLPAGGVKVRLIQFNDPEVRMDLLQPQAYQIASANQEWFPPSLHKKFLDLQNKEKLEQKRDEMETKKQEKAQQLEQKRGVTGGTALGTSRPGTGTYYQRPGDVGALSRQTGLRPRRGRDTGRTGRTDIGLYDDTAIYGEAGLAGGRQRRPRTRGPEPGIETDYLTGIDGREIKKGPASSDVYYEFQAISLNPITDLAKMREPLVFWAHDDTAEPGKSYRYRIRLGVFNPVAGTKQLNTQDKSLKNQVVLWSKFSDVTEKVMIPRMLYFFAKDIQEAAKKITVQVSKYVLGYWYSEDFSVRQGEVIGKLIESEPKEPQGIRLIGRQYGYVPPLPQQETTEPEAIDYSTGAVLVDAVTVNDWSGAGLLRFRNYFDMLYSFDGTNIEHMPIKPTNWTAELLDTFNGIKRLQREPKEPLRGWDSKVGGPRRLPAGLEGYEGEEYYEEEYDMMMMEEMMGQGRRY